MVKLAVLIKSNLTNACIGDFKACAKERLKD